MDKCGNGKNWNRVSQGNVSQLRDGWVREHICLPAQVSTL